jgi:hypothetical protein
MAKESGTKGVVDTRPDPGIDASLDELAKGLATGTLSRGKAIRWMGGALLGAALASVPGVAWANDCRPLGRECRRDSQCCSRNCIRRGDDKVCGCQEGQTRCGERCVNLRTNERHCGRCSNRCTDGECVNGMCQSEVVCEPPTTLCGGQCVDPATFQTDPKNCGSCGNACLAEQTCVEGFCRSPVGGRCGSASECQPDPGQTQGCDCRTATDGTSHCTISLTTPSDACTMFPGCTTQADCLLGTFCVPTFCEPQGDPGRCYPGC